MKQRDKGEKKIIRSSISNEISYDNKLITYPLIQA